MVPMVLSTKVSVGPQLLYAQMNTYFSFNIIIIITLNEYKLYYTKSASGYCTTQNFGEFVW